MDHAVRFLAAGRVRYFCGQSPVDVWRRLLPVAHTGRTNFSDDDLLFYTQSPDYCNWMSAASAAVVVTSGERARRKGRHGVVCR